MVVKTSLACTTQTRYTPYLSRIGAVAQSGERRLCTAEVRGSNPLGSTSQKSVFCR
jgi:hypothetical protein